MVKTLVESSYIYIQSYITLEMGILVFHFILQKKILHATLLPTPNYLYIPQGRLYREDPPFSMRQFDVLGDIKGV